MVGSGSHRNGPQRGSVLFRQTGGGAVVVVEAVGAVFLVTSVRAVVEVVGPLVALVVVVAVGSGSDEVVDSADVDVVSAP